MRAICIAVPLCLVIIGSTIASGLDLKFSAEIDTGTDQLILPDRLVVQTTLLPDPNNLMYTNLLQPPGPPDHDYIRISPENNDIDTRLQTVHDPNTMLLFKMKLAVNDSDQSGITGKSVFTFDNPDVLDPFFDDMLIYLRRFDKEGRYLGNYDLSNPENHTLQWQLTDMEGHYATIEVIAEKKTVAADLDNSNTVDLDDFALIARSWQSQVGLDGTDVYKDAAMDFNDMLIIAEVWLSLIN